MDKWNDCRAARKMTSNDWFTGLLAHQKAYRIFIFARNRNIHWRTWVLSFFASTPQPLVLEIGLNLGGAVVREKLKLIWYQASAEGNTPNQNVDSGIGISNFQIITVVFWLVCCRKRGCNRFLESSADCFDILTTHWELKFTKTDIQMTNTDLWVPKWSLNDKFPFPTLSLPVFSSFREIFEGWR